MKIDALQVVSRTVIIGLATPGIRRLLSLCLAGLPMPGMSRCVDSFLGDGRLRDLGVFPLVAADTGVASLSGVTMAMSGVLGFAARGDLVVIAASGVLGFGTNCCAPGVPCCILGDDRVPYGEHPGSGVNCMLGRIPNGIPSFTRLGVMLWFESLDGVLEPAATGVPCLDLVVIPPSPVPAGDDSDRTRLLSVPHRERRGFLGLNAWETGVP